MNQRSLITLAVAVVIGLGAMRLSQQMLSAGTGKTDQQTQEVLVAVRDVKVEESLKPDMVSVISMAKSAVPPNSFKSFKEVEERWVKTPLLEGDVLVEKKLGPKGTPPGLVSNIPKGMRALRHRRDRAVGRFGVCTAWPPGRYCPLRPLGKEQRFAAKRSCRTCWY